MTASTTAVNATAIHAGGGVGALPVSTIFVTDKTRAFTAIRRRHAESAIPKETDSMMDHSAFPCDICHTTPCTCEITEDDYEYGEPEETAIGLLEDEKQKYFEEGYDQCFREVVDEIKSWNHPDTKSFIAWLAKTFKSSAAKMGIKAGSI